jgi:DDE superfamily endonuclease
VKRFCIPPEGNAAFVQAMEDVLEVYHRPYDGYRPQVCLDETSKQLLTHTRVPIPASPGSVARVDDEYKRCGTANIFAAIEPLTGWSLVEATERRTSVDMAHFLRRISDEAFPDAEVIVLVMDMLASTSKRRNLSRPVDWAGAVQPPKCEQPGRWTGPLVSQREGY